MDLVATGELIKLRVSEVRQSLASPKSAIDTGEPAEVIYLIVPPKSDIQETIGWERLYLHGAGWFRCKVASQFEEILQAGIGAIGIVLILFVAFYGLYTLKSMMGIDLFPDKHLEDFVPIAGYQRW